MAKSTGTTMAVLAALSMAAAAQAETAIQAGLWEATDKTTMEGVQPIPAVSRQVCLKAGEAYLERLLFPSPAEIAQHGCKYQEGARQPGVLRATLVCPPTDEVAGIDAKAEITYGATSYEGEGQLLATDKAGTTIKGSSVLSGKRVGDC